MTNRAERPLKAAEDLFQETFGSVTRGRRWAYFVPGRIEVLGKHTDYAGGRSLLAATDCGIAVVAALNGGREVRLVNDAPGFGPANFPWRADLKPHSGAWTGYPMTVARRLARNFGEQAALEGVDIAVAGNLPPAGGMSSSSALVIASFFALAGPNGLLEDKWYRANVSGPEELAMYLACHENGETYRELAGDQGVGTFGGSEDHTAILCCQPDALSVYSFCPTQWEQNVAFPKGLVFVVCHSGVLAEKTGPALEHYNSVAGRAREACALYRHQFESQARTLGDLLDRRGGVSASEVLQRFERIPEIRNSTRRLLERVRQFVIESEELIPRAVAAVAAGNLEEFGRLVDRSHENAVRWLDNGVPEVEWLQRCARDLGARAASGFGAGFGGSVYAMVEAKTAADFAAQWEARYLDRFPRHRNRARWLVTRPSGAARQESLS